MARLSIQVSPELQQAVRLPPEEVPVRLEKELALRLYDKGLLTFGLARRLAGMTRWDFRDLLGEEEPGFCAKCLGMPTGEGAT